MSENSFISLTLNHLNGDLIILSSISGISYTVHQQVFNRISKRFEFSPYSASSGRMQANSSDSVIFLTVVLFPSYSSSALQEQYHPSIAFA